MDLGKVFQDVMSWIILIEWTVLVIILFFFSKKSSRKNVRCYFLLKVNPETVNIFDWWKRRGDSGYGEWHPMFYRRFRFYDKETGVMPGVKGDGVAIWLTGPEGGIYEMGEIDSLDYSGEPLADALPYMLESPSKRYFHPYIRYRITSSFHSNPITEAKCEETRFLRYIVKDMKNVPVYLMMRQQWEKIEEMLNESKITLKESKYKIL